MRFSLLILSVSGHNEYMSEEMRRNQHLITDDVMRFMAEYDVRLSPPLFSDNKHPSYQQTSGDPDVIGRLVLRLADWYSAWAPGGE